MRNQEFLRLFFYLWCEEFFWCVPFCIEKNMSGSTHILNCEKIYAIDVQGDLRTVWVLMVLPFFSEKIF